MTFIFFMTTQTEKVTAYLALAGNDETAVLRDDTRCFQTYAAAQAALDPHAKAGRRTEIIDLGPYPRKAKKPGVPAEAK